jgi:hypothetical protein
MDKKFFVVIPFYSNLDTRKVAQASKGLIETIFGKKEQVVTIDENILETGKTELKNRAQTVLAGLNGCGVQGVSLNTQELIELYYDFYNPDTATHQKLINFSNLTAPIIEKGEGSAYQPNLEKEVV